MFTLYSADITGNPGNCSYPHRHDVTDRASHGSRALAR